MTDFEKHGGGDRDFEFRVGPTAGPWDTTGFGDRLWQDVGGILDVALGQAPGVTQEDGGRLYGFQSDDVTVSLYVGEPDPGPPLESVPAMLTARSRSDTVETYQLAERLYDQLVGFGTYLVLVFDDNVMPVAANFDIGEW
ncbi:hypothetical protein OHA37_33070 [Streptomyces sp. NBC_00335]|uniref:hypothetical protein n=1 Tax=unclassified Streptomyces TaxID=2593676 RepID=UPI00224D2925|nr:MULTISPECIES: hypothetical protein [unclassified Streptomyces]MCX5408676.1 hypothetical protein [Streptomyces sp. NBC_00086]